MRTRNTTPLIVAGIIFAAVGAVLIFALRESMLGPLELPTLGVILIVVGAAMLIAGALMGRRRSATTTEEVSRSSDGRTEVRETTNDVA